MFENRSLGSVWFRVTSHQINGAHGSLFLDTFFFSRTQNPYPPLNPTSSILSQDVETCRGRVSLSILEADIRS